MRILHLIRGQHTHPGAPDDAAFAAMANAARVIADSPNDEHRVVLIGSRLAAGDADRAGLPVHRLIRAPLGIPHLAWSIVRAERRWGANEVMVWSSGLRPLERQLRPAAIDATAWSFDPRTGAPQTARATRHRPGTLSARPDTTPPRDQLRVVFGAGPTDRIVVLLADPPSAGDARRFAFTLGLIEVGVGPLIGVMSAGSSQLDRARRFHRLAVRRSPLIPICGSVVPFLLAADVAVLDGPPSLASTEAAERALRCGLILVAPPWLLEQRTDLDRSRIFEGGVRARAALPALLRALDASGITPRA